MSEKKWSARLTRKKGKQYIAVKFQYDPILIERIKQFEGAFWDYDNRVWLIPDSNEFRDRFGIERENQLTPEHHKGLKEFISWMRSKRYSQNTIKVYTEALAVFFKFHHLVKEEELEEHHLIQFNNDYIMKSGLSQSWQNQTVNALKLYYSRKTDVKLTVDLIHRPRLEHRLPHVLSKEEVKRILEQCQNLKHRMILSVIYACGLRRGELQRLELSDIDRHRMCIFIHQAKGKKDRIVPISKSLIEQLSQYYKQYKPKRYLFEGQNAGEMYSDRSMGMIMKQAVNRAGVSDKATLHWLRHSYATHLLDKGTDIRFIQELLGHNSTRTTEIYTHVSQRSLQQIISPFDDL